LAIDVDGIAVGDAEIAAQQRTRQMLGRGSGDRLALRWVPDDLLECCIG
jgi:hypothetical protein